MVYAAAGAAHFDGLMLATLLGAICLLDRAATEAASDSWPVSRAAWGSALLLGASMAFKIVPLALVPVWFFALGWRRAALTLPFALALPPLLAMRYGFPRAPVFSALSHFANDFRVNDAVWWIVDALGDARSPATGNAAYQAIAVCICGALAVWFRRDWRRGTLWVMGATLVLSPVLHAWYVVWILPLAAWRGSSARPWFVLSISVFAYFLLWEVNHESYRPWEEPVWLRLLIYLPPLAALGIKRPDPPLPGAHV